MAEVASASGGLPAKQVIYCGGTFLLILDPTITPLTVTVCSLPPEVGRQRNLSTCALSHFFVSKHKPHKDNLTNVPFHYSSTVNSAARPRNAPNGSKATTPPSTRHCTAKRRSRPTYPHSPSTHRNAPRKTPRRKQQRPLRPKPKRRNV